MTTPLQSAHYTAKDANLAGSTFCNVDLHEATFRDVNLRKSQFEDIAFTGATIRNACFADVSIEDANYAGMRIDGILVTDLLEAYCKKMPDGAVRLTKNMKTYGSATTFHVSDINASMKYYTEILGFSERFRFGDYAGVDYDGIQIHLSGPKATNKKEIGQGSIYIFCDDVDSFFTEVQSKGAKIQAEPKDYDYGMRDFVIEDPDCNLIGIGQETKNG